MLLIVSTTRCTGWAWREGERSLNENSDDVETAEKKPAGRVLRDREGPKDREASKDSEAPKRVHQPGGKAKRLAPQRRMWNN